MRDMRQNWTSSFLSGPPGTIFVLLLLASFGEKVVAQDATIRTTVPLVVLPTTVTDRRGHTIEGLPASSFVLRDNGVLKPVNVDTIDSGLAPIALVVLIQTSDISLSALTKIRQVGSVVSQAVVGENGEVALVTFDEDIRTVLGFTRDANAVTAAFANLKPSDNMGGRMLDAVSRSLDMLADRAGSRRANLLVIGESRDRGSKAKLDDLRPKVQRTGVTVYGLKYSAYLTPFTTKPEDYAPTGGGLLTGLGELTRIGKQNAFQLLTAATGGVVASFQTKSKLEKDLMQVARDIHSRYVLSFVPEQAEVASFHAISITIQDHPEAAVRSKPGYWTGF